MRKKTLLLIDGHNVFIRAYSGLKKQDLRNKDGFPTYGIYGALNTVASMIRRYEPSHVLIAFDHGRSSKRLSMDSKYKANRIKSKEEREKEGPDEFRPQFDIFLQACHRLGVPYLRLENTEADDILAKAVHDFAPSFEQVVIVSADHDIQQLIRSNVIVVKPSLGQSKSIKEETFDIDSIREEWKLDPWRLPEIWALTGDKGDNVEGIRGIGPKKATKIIQDYGSLDNFLESDNPLALENGEVVRMAYKLVTLQEEYDIPFPPLGNLQFNPSRQEDNQEHTRELDKLFSILELNNIKERWINGTLWKDPKLGRALNGQ